MSATNRETLSHGDEGAFAAAREELPKITPLPQAFPRISTQTKVEAVLGPRHQDEDALLKHALETDPMDPHLNPVFELLVHGESDVAGLLAYGLYKQNKRDWLIAFQANNGRAPDASELAAFILSERIPRRIATYRRLAEDLLTRDGYKLGDTKSGLFGASLQPANDATAVQSSLIQASKKAQTLRYIFGMLALVVVMAVLFRLAGAWLFS